MTRRAAALSSPSQLSQQPRPATGCGGPLRHDPVTGYCQRCDPDQASARQAQAAKAARASHVRPMDPRLAEWAASDAFDWTSRRNVHRALGEGARFVALDVLPQARMNAISNAARSRLGRRPPASGQDKRRPPVVVEKYQNGAHA